MSDDPGDNNLMVDGVIGGVEETPYAVNGGLVIGGKDQRCPVCGEEYRTGLGEGLIVSISPYSGTYCLKCWAKWISENIPRCEKISDKNGVTA
jgi:hypothetical protein